MNNLLMILNDWYSSWASNPAWWGVILSIIVALSALGRWMWKRLKKPDLHFSIQPTLYQSENFNHRWSLVIENTNKEPARDIKIVIEKISKNKEEIRENVIYKASEALTWKEKRPVEFMMYNGENKILRINKAGGLLNLPNEPLVISLLVTGSNFPAKPIEIDFTVKPLEVKIKNR